MKYRSEPVEVEAVQFDGLKSYEHMCEKWGTIFSRHRRCYLNGIIFPLDIIQRSIYHFVSAITGIELCLFFVNESPYLISCIAI